MDGASQGKPRVGGAGGTIHISNHLSFQFVVGLGDMTNNCAEFSACVILLRLSHKLGVHQLHIFGDYKLIIDCLKLRKPP